ncbi:organic hydroperoxide resistance protein [Bacillus tianshenii]|nr:organic hydroperoxide resistance protein [Bacillus tianshenii]
MDKPLYTAKATAVGGRNGSVKSDDGVVDYNLSMPKSLGGDGDPKATNPEQLFAAGYSACFGSALEMAAKEEKKDIDARVTANVSIGKDEESFGISVVMHVEVSGVKIDEAKELVARAHEVCPYSKATRGNIDVELNTELM